MKPSDWSALFMAAESANKSNKYEESSEFTIYERLLADSS